MNNEACISWIELLENNNTDTTWMPCSYWKNNPIITVPFSVFSSIDYIRQIRKNSGASIKDVLDRNRRNKNIIMKRVENKRNKKRTCKKI
jgi:hypothetical protein